MTNTPIKPIMPPMAQGKILVELFDLRQRCREMGFSDEAIAISLRHAPVWFPQLREQEAGQ